MSELKDPATGDFVAGIIRLLVEKHPELGPKDIAAFEVALCEHFGGEKHWVRSPRGEQTLAERVLSMFNGRNATEVARRLRCSRASVYRIIKQAGRR